MPRRPVKNIIWLQGKGGAKDVPCGPAEERHVEVLDSLVHVEKMIGERNEEARRMRLSKAQRKKSQMEEFMDQINRERMADVEEQRALRAIQ